MSPASAYIFSDPSYVSHSASPHNHNPILITKINHNLHISKTPYNTQQHPSIYQKIMPPYHPSWYGQSYDIPYISGGPGFRDHISHRNGLQWSRHTRGWDIQPTWTSRSYGRVGYGFNARSSRAPTIDPIWMSAGDRLDQSRREDEARRDEQLRRDYRDAGEDVDRIHVVDGFRGYYPGWHGNYSLGYGDDRGLGRYR